MRRPVTTLRELGEDAVVERLLRELPEGGEPVLLGPGDDCAVVAEGGRQRLLKTDALVCGVHFTPEAEPERVGWKAVARVQSDFAAMGGQARFLLITLLAPATLNVELLQGVMRGMVKAACQHGGVIVGGETGRSPVKGGEPAGTRGLEGLVISVAAEGEMAPGVEAVRRSGAQVGDRLYVTGQLGGSLGGKHLDFTPRREVGQWLAAGQWARAMMDLSDGLAADALRLGRASGVAVCLEEDRLPCASGCSPAQALGDGEDYELFFAVDPQRASALEATWVERFGELPLTAIGHCAAGAGEMGRGGWDAYR